MLVAFLVSSLADAAEPKPNFVVILCDDLGYGDLACYGHPKIKTPNIDKLAADGIKLTSCYCGQPVCSPSRAALFTGRNPNRYGIRDWIAPASKVHLSKREITIASLLKLSGYRTCLAGKWHLNSAMDGSEPTPGDHGFEHWFATQNNAAPSHIDPNNLIRNGVAVGPMKGHATTLVVDESIAFLDQAKDKPFALFATFHAPHEPVATPKDVENEYKDEANTDLRSYYGSVALIDREVSC
jgi:arylsulfatase A